MRIDPKEHETYNWEVHHLLTDFRIEDAWRLPVVLHSEHRLDDLLKQFWYATEKVELKGLAGWLFRFRFYLGRLFHWDEKITHTTLVSGSIRERYARANNLGLEQLPDPGNGNFVPVYILREETLSEIENATVHAAIHLGRVPIENQRSIIHMTIYVKPKGIFGRLYMFLIRPFRWLIVYPTLLKTIKRQWEDSISR